jgi:hypothetical protein
MGFGSIGHRLSRAARHAGRGIERAGENVGHGTAQLAQDPHQWVTDHQPEIYAAAGGPLLTPLGLGAQHEDRLPGQKSDKLFGGQQAAQDAKAYQNELAAEQAREANIRDLQTQANAKFGVGMSPEAMANASRIRTQRNAVQQAALAQGRGAADAEYGAGLTQNRIGLARSGLTGSGIDASNRGNLISKYYGDLAGAQSKANQVGQGYDTSLTGTRSALLRGIGQGQITDTTGIRTDISSFQNANPYLAALGNSASGIANGISSNRLSAAYST